MKKPDKHGIEDGSSQVSKEVPSTERGQTDDGVSGPYGCSLFMFRFLTALRYYVVWRGGKLQQWVWFGCASLCVSTLFVASLTETSLRIKHWECDKPIYWGNCVDCAVDPTNPFCFSGTVFSALLFLVVPVLSGPAVFLLSHLRSRYFIRPERVRDIRKVYGPIWNDAASFYAKCGYRVQHDISLHYSIRGYWLRVWFVVVAPIIGSTVLFTIPSHAIETSRRFVVELRYEPLPPDQWLSLFPMTAFWILVGFTVLFVFDKISLYITTRLFYDSTPDDLWVDGVEYTPLADVSDSKT